MKKKRCKGMPEDYRKALEATAMISNLPALYSDVYSSEMEFPCAVERYARIEMGKDTFENRWKSFGQNLHVVWYIFV